MHQGLKTAAGAASTQGLQGRAQQRGASGQGFDETTVFQVFHDAADHFARGANGFGQVLAGNLVFNDLLALGIGMGLLNERMGYAPVEITFVKV